MVAEAGLGCTASFSGNLRSCILKLPMRLPLSMEQCTQAIVFVVAVVVMAVKPILLHLTRDEGVAPFPAAQFLLAVEMTKSAICVVALSSYRIRGTAVNLWHGWLHSVAFAKPAAIYLLMNMLVVRNARALSPPTFQLLANTKILTTAMVAWIISGRHITAGQWVALVLLTVGVVLGDWRGGSESITEYFQASVTGVLTMLLCSCLSAFASVLMETRLKAPETRDMTIFATNLHTSVYTLVLNTASLCLLNSSAELMPNRALNTADMIALVNEAANGIMMSLLMRRRDSVAKNFAFSMSVFVTGGFSAIFLAWKPPVLFFVGACLVAVSGVMYASMGATQTVAADVKKQA